MHDFCVVYSCILLCCLSGVINNNNNGIMAVEKRITIPVHQSVVGNVS